MSGANVTVNNSVINTSIQAPNAVAMIAIYQVSSLYLINMKFNCAMNNSVSNAGLYLGGLIMQGNGLLSMSVVSGTITAAAGTNT